MNDNSLKCRWGGREPSVVKMSPLNRLVSFFHGDSNNNCSKKSLNYPKTYTSDLNIYGDTEKLKKHYLWASLRKPYKKKGIIFLLCVIETYWWVYVFFHFYWEISLYETNLAFCNESVSKQWVHFFVYRSFVYPLFDCPRWNWIWSVMQIAKILAHRIILPVYSFIMRLKRPMLTTYCDTRQSVFKRRRSLSNCEVPNLKGHRRSEYFRDTHLASIIF